MEEQVEEEEQQPLAPPSQLPAPSPSSTNHSVVDMELTCLSPNPNPSTSDMDLNGALSFLHAHKKEINRAGGGDNVPEEFQPLAVSTPNDPQGSVMRISHRSKAGRPH